MPGRGQRRPGLRGGQAWPKATPLQTLRVPNVPGHWGLVVTSSLGGLDPRRSTGLQVAISNQPVGLGRFWPRGKTGRGGLLLKDL